MTYKPIMPMVIIVPILVFILGVCIYSIVKRKSEKLDKALAIGRISVIIILMFFINLRPMRKVYDMQVEMKNIDVLIVMDTTISMWALDYDGKDPRMDGVSADCEYIINELIGSNFGLIRFDNRAQVLAPFTQDANTVRDAISTIKTPDIYYAKGSNMSVAYEELEKMLISSSEKEGRLTMLFFISDGEITDGSALQSFKDLEKYVDGGAVLGYGTAKGGRMKNSYGGYIKDPKTNSDGYSVINEDNLKQIANDLDIDYIHMTKQSNISYLVDSIKTGSSLVMGDSDAIVYEDIYFYFAFPMLLLLVWEVIVFVRKGRL